MYCSNTFWTFTYVSSFRSLSTRALPCDIRKGKSWYACCTLLLIGIGVDFMEELTLEVVIGVGWDFDRHVQWLACWKIASELPVPFHITSACWSYCCPLSRRCASESTVSHECESSFASKVASGIQTKGSHMMLTGHCSLLWSDEGWALHLYSRSWYCVCCEKMFQFRELPIRKSTTELRLTWSNCLPLLSSSGRF